MTDAAWEALLERFEADLAGTATVYDWIAPATPLPAELAERTRRLLGQQEERMRQLRRERDDVHAQLIALSRIPAVRTDAPALLDREL